MSSISVPYAVLDNSQVPVDKPPHHAVINPASADLGVGSPTRSCVRRSPLYHPAVSTCAANLRPYLSPRHLLSRVLPPPPPVNYFRRHVMVDSVSIKALIYRVGQTQLGSFSSLITNQSNNTRENGKVHFDASSHLSTTKATSPFSRVLLD
jgi:hypothetical protein